jgi:ATP-binding cassette subfamily B protein
MIAHRLSTIAFADNIVVMEDGKVAEEGPQSSLLAREGPYRRLYELQMLPNTDPVL